MAVNIKIEEKLEHHRNPSGLINKIDWLLVHMDWDINNFDKLFKQIVVGPKDSKTYKSWENAFRIAYTILAPKCEFSGPSKELNKYEIDLMLDTLEDKPKYQKFVKKWWKIRKERYGY